MKTALSKKIRILFIIIILTSGFGLLGCASTYQDENTSEYPRQGARSSQYVEGPHLIYKNDQIIMLNSTEYNGQMVLVTEVLNQSSLDSLQVYKAGFLPRSFKVRLQDSISQPQTHYLPADSIFAVSDIEGNFNTLVNLLQQNNVINDQLDWIFGSGHFVLIGDIFDRGNHVTEMLWFLYHLEDQARESNGFVHAGLSPTILQSGYNLEDINRLAHASLGKAKTGYTETDQLIQGKAGPFWYRGYFDVNIESSGPRATQTDVDSILDHFGGSLVIVGHTHVTQPELRYQGKVCAINVVQPADHLVYTPPVQSFGILIQGSNIFRADENGVRTKLTIE